MAQKRPQSLRPNPCIRTCRVKDGRCLGCGRTREEIQAWRDKTRWQRLVRTVELLIRMAIGRPPP